MVTDQSEEIGPAEFGWNPQINGRGPAKIGSAAVDGKQEFGSKGGLRKRGGGHCGLLPDLEENENLALDPVITMVTRELLRWQQLSSDERRLLWRAVLLLTAASLAVRLLPFRRAILFGSIPVRSSPLIPLGTCIWAIAAAARRLPWRLHCIEKGLAAQNLLRWAGIEAMLHYGARHHPQTAAIEAHVWVSVDGRPILGGEEAAHFAAIAIYPSERS